MLTMKYKWALVRRPFGVCGSTAFVKILKKDTRTPVKSSEFLSGLYSILNGDAIDSMTKLLGENKRL